MMDLVHYSNSEDFELSNIESVPGFGHGLFVYPVSKDVQWAGRRPFYFRCDDGVAQFVQSFEPGEFGENEVVELFVAATDFGKLNPLY